MNKKNEWLPYIRASLAGFGAIAMSLLLFFLLFRFEGFSETISRVVSILRPFIFGAVMGYLLIPVCNFLETNLKKVLKKQESLAKPLAIFLSILFGIGVVSAIIALVLPKTVDSIIRLSQIAPDKFRELYNRVESFLSGNEILVNYLEQAYETVADKLDSLINDTIIPEAGIVISGVGQGVYDAAMVLKDLVIGLIVAIYFLGSRKTFRKQAKMLLYAMVKPEKAALITEELHFADKMFSGFINGKLIDSLIIGLLCFVLCLIFQIPNTVLVSTIIGVTNIIPFFGPIIGGIPCVLLVFIESPIKALIFLVIVVGLQQFDGNYLGPKILGDSLGISSFWILFSILFFGGLFGFVGMLIGVPLFAVIYDIIRKLVHAGLKKNQMEGRL